jgi:hypothetical protein
MQPVARAHDRIRATFALVLGATTVLAGAVGRVLHAGPWPTELVVSALALALTSLLALVVVWPRAGQAASLGVLPLAALLGVVMMVWALAVPEQGPRLWPAAVAAAGGATTLAAFARWTLASGAHVLPRLALTPSDRYAVAKGGQGKAKMSAAGTIAPGDRVEVPAGQRVPTDGVVREGSGFADERSLTAAELAVAKGVGDSVLAGTTTDIPMLVYEARASYADSLAPRIHAHAQALVQAVAHAGVAAGGRVWAVILGAVGLLGAIGVLLLPEQGRGVVAALPVMAGVLLAVNASAPSVAARSALAWALVRAIHRGVLPREPEALRALGRVGRWEVDTRLVAPTGTVEVAGGRGRAAGGGRRAAGRGGVTRRAGAGGRGAPPRRPGAAGRRGAPQRGRLARDGVGAAVVPRAAPRGAGGGSRGAAARAGAERRLRGGAQRLDVAARAQRRRGGGRARRDAARGARRGARGAGAARHRDARTYRRGAARGGRRGRARARWSAAVEP